MLEHISECHPRVRRLKCVNESTRPVKVVKHEKCHPIFCELPEGAAYQDRSDVKSMEYQKGDELGPWPSY